MTSDNGGPAFSVASDGAQVLEYGMTLRDYFAGQAMAGQLAYDDSPCAADAARFSYILADAMLAERNKADTP